MPQKTYSIREAARLVGVDHKTVSYYIKKQRIIPIKCEVDCIPSSEIRKLKKILEESKWGKNTKKKKV